jgi:large subunit ribosomal protein L4
MELPIVNLKGEPAGALQVSEELFGQPMRAAVVHQAVVAYNANLRHGTQSAKTRAEVAGGGKKPWRQKYTGRARQGSTRSPQWRHGGVVFAPKPRSYRQKLPRQMRQLALRCILSEKVRQGSLVLVDQLAFSESKTKAMAQTLAALGVKGTALVVTREPELSVITSARNLQGVRTLPVSLLNANELLKRHSLVITVDAVKRAEELWGAKQTGGEGDAQPVAAAEAAKPGEEAKE